jgi:hypothetical protein
MKKHKYVMKLSVLKLNGEMIKMVNANQTEIAKIEKT